MRAASAARLGTSPAALRAISAVRAALSVAKNVMSSAMRPNSSSAAARRSFSGIDSTSSLSNRQHIKGYIGFSEFRAQGLRQFLWYEWSHRTILLMRSPILKAC